MKKKSGPGAGKKFAGSPALLIMILKLYDFSNILFQCVQFMVCSIHAEAEIIPQEEILEVEEDEAYLVDEIVSDDIFASDEEMEQEISTSKMQKPVK